MLEEPLLNEWSRKPGVMINKRVRMKKYAHPHWDHRLRPTCPDAEEVFNSIAMVETDALELTVSVEELVRLLKDQEKLQKLMYLPEVRQAIFYYRLSGEIDE